MKQQFMRGEKCSFTSNEHLSITVTEVYTGERKWEELKGGRKTPEREGALNYAP